MKIADVRARAFAMPLDNPPGPYRFYGREYFVIEYLTDPDALRTVVPEPLGISGPLVKLEFVRLPGTTGFGDFTECDQMIPVSFEGESAAHPSRRRLRLLSPVARFHCVRFGPSA